MAKKKRPKPQSSWPEATHVQFDMRLDADIYRFCVSVAKLADTTPNTVINVMLATEVLRRGAGSASVPTEKP